MIIVADTSPINYLLLISQVDLLPQLFQEIIIPDVVRDEMLDPDAPLILQQWIANPPSWLTVQSVPEVDPTLNTLDPGEQAAITLAQTLSTARRLATCNQLLSVNQVHTTQMTSTYT